jgi:hypothetical protein
MTQRARWASGPWTRALSVRPVHAWARRHRLVRRRDVLPYRAGTRAGLSRVRREVAQAIPSISVVRTGLARRGKGRRCTQFYVSCDLLGGSIRARGRRSSFQVVDCD